MSGEPGARRDWSGWDMVRCPSEDPVGDCEPGWVQIARDLEPTIVNLPGIDQYEEQQ